MLIALSAALAGVMHVLSGPDHLAAIAPLSSGGRRRGWVAGWTWGLGHSSGVVVVGVLAIMFRDLLPPVGLVSAWGERAVGGALIALGFWALVRVFAVREAPHLHNGVAHSHPHVGRGPAFFPRLGHAHAAFLVGVLHGVAGTSHFLGVLPALALPTRIAALTYVLVFGMASIAAMTAFAAVVGIMADRAAVHGASAHRLVVMTGAAVAIVVGSVWVIGASGS
jgi:hypothetical protein